MDLDNKKVSMIDIAQLSGVSVATVSRILNKNGRYSAQTEKKVMDTIEKYGYQINFTAKALRTNRSQSIGVIVPDITNEFFAKIVRSIENYLVGLDYTLFVCDSNEDEKTEMRHINNLISKDVDGIIYISGRSDVKEIHKQFNIPVVYIDRRPKHAGKLIISDNEKGGFMATECMIKKGCKKILMLRDYRNLSPIQHRLNGYKKALESNGLSFDENFVIDIKVDYSAAKEKVEELINTGLEFDGIFACTDMMAIGALHALENHGFKVPEQVKVVGFDNITASAICNPPLTTIEQNTEKFGKDSVDALMNLINKEKSYSDITLEDVNLIDRATV